MAHAKKTIQTNSDHISMCYTSRNHNGYVYISVCTDISTLNGNLIGTGNDVGAIRTVVCNTGFEERSKITTITCEFSGNWSYNPICNVINGDNYLISTA
jgi:hypothetical protein